ncbi:acetyl-CoA synthetase [Tistrella bauzanensis]|uniref:Acetyl-CoA synthetase n=1 Tax=Tistrella bauzanensis TaxID=657419 RepID=A0ABQ1IHE9_9PROT|nr:AMP-binding protein [Tistrella bauzanensis]GGB39681.1 acetyl-CoA synthetase [Tistrella bauzanensis]
MIRPSAHRDTFTRDNLPPPDEWPDLIFDRPELHYPDRLNAAAALLARARALSDPDEPAIFWGAACWTFRMLDTCSNQLAGVLVDHYRLVPGERVLLRGANTPMLFAAWLAVIKAGGVAVTTMPMLRAMELAPVIDKARIQLAICEDGLVGALEDARHCTTAGSLRAIAVYGGDDDPLAALMQRADPDFQPVATAQDDVCLIAFTSGTTGSPKAAAHFHRDVLAMCDTFARHILKVERPAVFCGTPPIAFTFGLGALLAFPLSAGCAVALPEHSTPAALARAIADHRASHVFTSPTAYRALLQTLDQIDLASVRLFVSAGEHLPEETWHAWRQATGAAIVNGLGTTEMIHIVLSAAGRDIVPGATGRPVPGYEACLLDPSGDMIDGPGEGRLAVRGPTGCRYLADPRQRDYVVRGWNVTGDIYRRDAAGYYWYVGRSDDMIVSSGYNIAAPEIEAALYRHDAVAECAVIGWPDADRGQIVKAVVVPAAGIIGDAALVKVLQDHVKQTLAPYKYPRLIEFRDALPKTANGKLRRAALKAAALAD